MKLAIVSTAVIAAAVLSDPTQAKASPEVEIKDAVARVVVIVEDRADVAVEVTQGNTRLPKLQVRRRGDEIQIDGGLGGRRFNDAIRNCRSGPADARQPGDGASVEVRDLGRINVSDAPLIIIRSPRDVNVSAGSAVFGAVGRGARSVELSNGGCGDWVVANTDGSLDLSSAPAPHGRWTPPWAGRARSGPGRRAIWICRWADRARPGWLRSMVTSTSPSAARAKSPYRGDGPGRSKSPSAARATSTSAGQRATSAWPLPAPATSVSPRSPAGSAAASSDQAISASVADLSDQTRKIPGGSLRRGFHSSGDGNAYSAPSRPRTPEPGRAAPARSRACRPPPKL
jgi:hypothetical protein